MTNAEYAAYLDATGYQPADPTNFLKLWDHSGPRPAVPTGFARKPVTGLGLAEARAYCAWRGARLPHSYEWQYAAQGTDGLPMHIIQKCGPTLHPYLARLATAVSIVGWPEAWREHTFPASSANTLTEKTSWMR